MWAEGPSPVTTLPGADPAGHLAPDFLAGDLAGDKGGDLAGDLAGGLAGDLAGDKAGEHRRHRSSRWSISLSLSPVDLLHCCREALIQHHDKLPQSGGAQF